MTVKVECNVEREEEHPATGLLLKPGEMEVTDEQAAQLEHAGKLKAKWPKRAPKPEKEE